MSKAKEILKVLEMAMKEDEKKIATKMKQKGYKYVILFSNVDLDPLYVKTMPEVSELLKTEFKNEKNYKVMKVEDYLAVPFYWAEKLKKFVTVPE